MIAGSRMGLGDAVYRVSKEALLDAACKAR